MILWEFICLVRTFSSWMYSKWDRPIYDKAYINSTWSSELSVLQVISSLLTSSNAIDRFSGNLGVDGETMRRLQMEMSKLEDRPTVLLHVASLQRTVFILLCQPDLWSRPLELLIASPRWRSLAMFVIIIRACLLEMMTRPTDLSWFLLWCVYSVSACIELKDPLFEGLC